MARATQRASAAFFLARTAAAGCAVRRSASVTERASSGKLPQLFGVAGAAGVATGAETVSRGSGAVCSGSGLGTGATAGGSGVLYLPKARIVKAVTAIEKIFSAK